MLFLGIIMCLGMALSVHADSGQFFNFEPEKWDKEGFSWTDSKGQIWNAYEYGTKGEAFISSVDKATSMELQFPLFFHSFFLPHCFSHFPVNGNTASSVFCKIHQENSLFFLIKRISY